MSHTLVHCLRELSEKLDVLHCLKTEVAHLNRSHGQFLARHRKSSAMKDYWAKKKAVEAAKRKDEEYVASLSKKEYHRSCTCHLGNPPCTFCTDSNYCESCDINTWDEYCPKCGALIEQ